MGATFPLFFPADARRVFGTEESVRRIARVADWGSGARILELGCGSLPSTLVLAKELGCHVTAVDDDQAGLDKAMERAKSHGLGDRLETRKVDFKSLSFTEGQFDGIVATGSILMPLSEAVKTLRPYLAPRGRIALTYPVRVGRYPAGIVLEHWEKRLGEPLVLPRDCLQTVEKGGFEPESAETLSNIEIDDYYRLLEPHVAIDEPAKPLRDEMDLHRTAGGRGSFSYALVVGRRKEPGEKPPISRNE
ncbi:MAG: SAM-dependent methyltransferase [Myxococcaceae bacterium]